MLSVSVYRSKTGLVEQCDAYIDEDTVASSVRARIRSSNVSIWTTPLFRVAHCAPGWRRAGLIYIVSLASRSRAMRISTWDVGIVRSLGRFSYCEPAVVSVYTLRLAKYRNLMGDAVERFQITVAVDWDRHEDVLTNADGGCIRCSCNDNNSEYYNSDADAISGGLFYHVPN
ncbi:hypothetical protein BDR03DRAFT_54167 [Suillus americanus]|nr:hypothetical protein BDR03DRAFT_54167 [Suillus americanus]